MQPKKILPNLVFLFFAASSLLAQQDRWQQRVRYKMDVDFDVKRHQYMGKQKLTYWNNSPEVLTHVFYHLYFNAFQPNSAMDVRSRTIADPDPRVGSRIAALKPDQIGYLKPLSLKMGGKACKFKVEGTILEVELPKPIAPNSKVTFEMDFEGQIPIQIRRSGRDSKEGIDYSMAQWYPKMCEYDYQGWHANPYIGREFHGVWGDFNVNISIDRRYRLGGTGILTNEAKIEKELSDKNGIAKNLTWKFAAKNVHDFMWAADRDYVKKEIKADDGTRLIFLYQPSEKTESWEKLPVIMSRAWGIIGKKFGKYPYPQYSFIQGGDGGMEYAMATLVTGERNLRSLVGVSVHEGIHAWYQGVLGTNESLYGWMDEGFTSYAENQAMNWIRAQNLLPGEQPQADPMLSNVQGYCRFALSGREEALTTHADHYQTNTAYSVASYVKGSTFLQQLRYIVGNTNFDASMLKYFDTWKFKHPNPNDLVRIFEKQSDLELDWFKEYFVNTTLTIDYSVKTVSNEKITIERIGKVPMPVEVLVTFDNGEQVLYYIPLDLMRGEKPSDGSNVKRVILPDWQWVNGTYDIETTQKVKKIEIDPSLQMADVKRENNLFPQEKAE